MFDVGFLELAVILVLALLVLGPERLPKAARSVGYWFGKTRRYVEGMKEQVEAEVDATEVKRLLHNQEVQIRELRDKLGDAGDYVNSEMQSQFDDDDPGNGHQDVAEEPDEMVQQYDIIEEDDDGSWGEDTPQGEGHLTSQDEARTEEKPQILDEAQ